jgi:hypothetical protein
MTMKPVVRGLNAEICKTYFVIGQEINLTITSDTFLYISSTGTDDAQVLLASYSLKLSRCCHVYKWHTKESFCAKLAGVSESSAYTILSR